MRIKRYFAKDMRAALTEVKKELGPDAVIMSNKKTASGIEIVAAVDNDAVAASAKETAARITQAPAKALSAYAGLNDPEDKSMVASSLQELLSRQQGQPDDTTISKRETPDMSANRQKTERAVEALSQQAESEFEQWLSKARTTVAQTEEHDNDVASEPVALHSKVEELNATRAPSQSFDNYEQKAEMASLRSELHSIKELLEHQVSSLMKQDLERRSPSKAMLFNKLKGMGLSGQVAEHLIHFMPERGSLKDAWQGMLDLLTQQLDTTNNEIITRGGVYALVGPTGVGKTTTIAKLAARYAQIHGGDKVGLISTDSFRIGALEQLATYAKILGCPLKQARNSEELSEAIYQLRNKKLILIDTAGMSQRDLKLTERLNNLLSRSRVNIKNYLVLSATSQISVLQESVKHFKTLPLSGCVFTKIDESLSLGELMSVAIHNRLPIGYLTNGQRVPEDIRVANTAKIVQKANQLFELKQKLAKQQEQVAAQAVGMYD